MAYFTHTGTEYTYEALRRHLAEGRLKKLYRKHNFDINRYQELQVRTPPLRVDAHDGSSGSWTRGYPPLTLLLQRAVVQTEVELAAPEVHLLKFQTLALQ
jgi:hypothetical protein